MKSIYYIVVVWGKDYVDSFLRVTLPSLLSDSNLRGMDNTGSKFIIVTDYSSIDEIKKSPEFIKLESMIRGVIVLSHRLTGDEPPHLKAAREQRAVTYCAVEDNAACVYLSADFIISDGGLRYIRKMVDIGHKALFMAIPRINREDVMSLFTGSSYKNIRNSRSLISGALSFLHEDDQRYNWASDYFSLNPVVLAWNVPNERGLLIHAFHLHPIMACFDSDKNFDLLDKTTIDGEFIEHCIPRHKIAVVQDSDHIAAFSLTKRYERLQPLVKNKASVKYMRKVTRMRHITKFHRWLFEHDILLHVDNLNRTWDNTIQAVEREFIKEILK